MKNKNSQEKLINKAIEYHLKGNIQAASKYYRQLIGQGLNNHKSIFLDCRYFKS